jgi:large subunit ribosomal protein L22
MLRFLPTPHARLVAKVLHSAAANAENNYSLDRDELRVKRAFAGEGPTLKRWRAKARGRAAPILKRTSHITVVVEDR